MVEITIRLDEEKLKDIIHDLFESYCLGDSMDYFALYIKYIDHLIDSGSASFFHGPTDLETWVKDIINNDNLIVITPLDSDYKRIYQCFKDNNYDIGNGYFIVEEHNDCILLELYS